MNQDPVTDTGVEGVVILDNAIHVHFSLNSAYVDERKIASGVGDLDHLPGYS
jgi:hypothetical protein